MSADHQAAAAPPASPTGKLRTVERQGANGEPPFAFTPTHVVRRGTARDQTDSDPPSSGVAVMLVDRCAYTRASWNAGGDAEYVSGWSGWRTADGRPVDARVVDPDSGRRPDWESMPGLYRKHFHPHEREDRPPFLATHRLDDGFGILDEVMVIDGAGYTAGAWLIGEHPEFASDAHGWRLSELPDHRPLPEAARLTDLPLRYAGWTDGQGLAHVAVVTPTGVEEVAAVPWDAARGWSAEQRRHLAALVVADVTGVTAADVDAHVREVVAERLRTLPRFGWEVDRIEVHAWVAAAVPGETIDSRPWPFLPTHELTETTARGLESATPVMLCGTTAYTEDAWRGLAKPTHIVDTWTGVWRTRCSGAPLPEDAVTPYVERVVGWTDSADRPRVCTLGPAGVQEFVRTGQTLDWRRSPGREHLSDLLIEHAGGAGEEWRRLAVGVRVNQLPRLGWSVTVDEVVRWMRTPAPRAESEGEGPDRDSARADVGAVPCSRPLAVTARAAPRPAGRAGGRCA